MAQPNIPFGAGNNATPAGGVTVETIQLVGGEHLQNVVEASKASISKEWTFTAAQTNVALVTATGTERILFLYSEITVSDGAQAAVGARLGLTTAASLPAAGAGGAVGILSSHAGIPKGLGLIRTKAKLGLAGEDLLFTCSDPSSGTVRVVVEYLIVNA